MTEFATPNFIEHRMSGFRLLTYSDQPALGEDINKSVHWQPVYGEPVHGEPVRRKPIQRKPVHDVRIRR